MLRKIVLASCLAILASAIHDDNKHSEKSSETPCVHVKSKFSELEIGGTGVFTIQACEPLELSQTVVLGLPDCVFTKTTEVTLPAGKSVAVPVTVIAAEYGTGKISLRGNEIGVVLGAVAVSVVKHSWVQTISTIIGWLYFTAWSVSFYPQCIENYQLQSVAGMRWTGCI
ncbi:hypothetical protein SARC_10667 [Sphaeroforma arctica JP610]|uniref:IPT/TIG domain-containing protein n=1 Tax=Sphaeroforma arctica JP610 TaxID=667725 RepID=A0A0L0FJB7_9EUKA|nr:hypothetical protein SARC_10667 [Sphaeroforma arctica JP610]KNC76860.1 hypothetical protein SARC_10667 [Sphaeroforma arctica JP610]|eukprot:XP_014150762.1 hypothetical protein SARC_10667 [Sphaeroforma arctica JP610]